MKTDTILLKLILTLSLTLSVFTPTSFGRNYHYNGSSRIVGQLEYAIIDEQCNDLHDLARQYNVGYDALLNANPQLNKDSELETGMLVYIPNKIIVPKKLNPYTVYINLAEKRLFFYEANQNNLLVFPVGVGRIDHPSPTGHMHVTQKRYKPTWNVPKGVLAEAHANGYTDHPTIMPPGPDNPLGDYAVHLSARTYLIHSTHNPDLIGTRNTSGCINLYPEHLAILYKKIAVKTPIEIFNTPLKVTMVNHTIYAERYPTMHETTADQSSHSQQSRITADTHRIMTLYEKYHYISPSDNDPVDKLDQILHTHLGHPIAVLTT